MGIGDFISGVFGSKNKERAPEVEVDPNAYQYGGRAGGADEAANRYRGIGEGAQNRQGVQVDYGQANQDRALALQARGQQGQVADAMMARAMGRTQSIAQMQADRQMGQAAAAQQSAAASARGPAALALAQGNAGANTAQAQSAIAGQAQINAANERLQAEQAAFGAASGMRGQDMGSQQQSAQQAQFQGQLNDAQRGRNDQMQMGMTQAEMGVRNAQLGASQNQQAQIAANKLGAAGINAGVGGQNAAMNQQNSMSVLGMAQGVAGGITGSDIRMKMAPPQMRADGGPIAAGQPYIVGERGPELVVPSQPGTVVPNEAIAPSTWGAAPADEDAQRFAAQQAATQQATVGALQQSMGAGGVNENPWARDVRQVSALRQASPGLVSAEDRERERHSRSILSSRMKQDAPPAADSKDEKAAVEAGEKVPEQKKPATLSSRLGGALSKAGSDTMDRASRVDTSYHGGGGYVPPQLISMTPSDIAAKTGLVPITGPSAPSFAGQSGMLGGSPKGELAAHSDFATQFARNPGGMAVSDERAKKVIDGEQNVANANRAQESSAYAYKPEFTPPEQEEGELNVGPMAQTMAEDPVASTAVKKDPSGLLVLDNNKLNKVQSAGLASLQRQVDALSKAVLSSRMRKGK